MRIFVCYLVVPIEDEENGTYHDFRFLDQLGAFATAQAAFDALLDWAEHLFTRSNVRGYNDENRCEVIVDGREYCVGAIEFHNE